MVDQVREIQEQHAARGRHVQSIVQKVIHDSVISDANPCIDLFSMNTYQSRLSELTRAFERVPNVMHGLAVKAQPIRGILSAAKDMGFGAECASFTEAQHALALGFESRKIIYDSPCKTYDELKQMIQARVYINLDNQEEIEKVNQIARVDQIHPEPKQIGLRVNPVVGAGTILSTSTATKDSKFGLPWTPETTDKLLSLYQANPWLQGVHVHIGSQGIALDVLTAGIKRAAEFAQLVNAHVGSKQIQVIDIGGGLPTQYDGIHEAFTFTDYTQALEQAAPSLFSGEYELLTEFGRSVFVKSGITVTKVEAVKDWCNQRFAVIHVGANQFLRTVYLPHQWSHPMTVFTAQGEIKEGPFMKQDIAGPMCFSGDFMGRNVMLPEIETGDYLVIHDTGGYTTSMYSKYNSRRANAMYAYDDKTNALTVLKERETCEETLQFWGLVDPVPLDC